MERREETKNSGAEESHLHVIFITSYFKNDNLTEIKIQGLFFDLDWAYTKKIVALLPKFCDRYSFHRLCCPGVYYFDISQIHAYISC